jgi:hypothetical protein
MRAGFAEQPIPRRAAAVDDLVNGAKDAVRQAIVAQIQPQPLDWVEFGRVGRKTMLRFSGTPRSPAVCQPALSISTTPRGPGR